MVHAAGAAYNTAAGAADLGVVELLVVEVAALFGALAATNLVAAEAWPQRQKALAVPQQTRDPEKRPRGSRTMG